MGNFRRGPASQRVDRRLTDFCSQRKLILLLETLRKLHSRLQGDLTLAGIVSLPFVIEYNGALQIYPHTTLGRPPVPSLRVSCVAALLCSNKLLRGAQQLFAFRFKHTYSVILASCSLSFCNSMCIIRLGANHQMSVPMIWRARFRDDRGDAICSHLLASEMKEGENGSTVVVGPCKARTSIKLERKPNESRK